MLSILILDNSPTATALDNTNPGSLVWICTFITSSYPTTIIESPRGSISSWNALALEASPNIINSVQYPNLISISSIAWALAPVEALADISFISAFIPSFNASYIPCNMIYNPIPPESTTLAFLSAGKRSGVLSNITFDSTTISPNNSTISVFLLFTAASEAALITESIVPSVGFITAL